MVNSRRDRTYDVLRECSKWARQNTAQIDGLCLTNQRETAAAWDRESGETIGSCDQLAMPPFFWHMHGTRGCCSNNSRSNGPTSPAVLPSAACFGICDETHGIDSLPIVAVAGDSHAALIGSHVTSIPNSDNKDSSQTILSRHYRLMVALSSDQWQSARH